MATLNISITASVAEFGIFADELGYNKEVTDFNNGTPITTPNPQTKQAFLEEQFKNVTTSWLAARKVQAIDQQIRDQRVAEKEAIKSAIEGAVNVHFA